MSECGIGMLLEVHYTAVRLVGIGQPYFRSKLGTWSGSRQCVCVCVGWVWGVGGCSKLTVEVKDLLVQHTYCVQNLDLIRCCELILSQDMLYPPATSRFSLSLSLHLPSHSHSSFYLSDAVGIFSLAFSLHTQTQTTPTISHSPHLILTHPYSSHPQQARTGFLSCIHPVEFCPAVEYNELHILFLPPPPLSLPSYAFSLFTSFPLLSSRSLSFLSAVTGS